MLEFVVPGHYRHKDSVDLNSGLAKETTVQVIRIYGESEIKPGYWVIGHEADGEMKEKTLHESEILHNWVLIDTVMSPKHAEAKERKKLPSHLLAGIGEETKVPENVVLTEEQTPLLNPNNIPSVQQVPVKPLYTPEEEFTINILKKLKQSQTSKVNLTVSIDLPYDVNKLRESIELLNLNKETLIKFLLHDLDLLPQISKSIGKNLIDGVNNIEDSMIHPGFNDAVIEQPKQQVVTPEQPQIIEPVKPKLTEQEILEKMSNIDNRFSSIKNNLI